MPALPPIIRKTRITSRTAWSLEIRRCRLFCVFSCTFLVESTVGARLIAPKGGIGVALFISFVGPRLIAPREEGQLVASGKFVFSASLPGYGGLLGLDNMVFSASLSRPIP